MHLNNNKLPTKNKIQHTSETQNTGQHPHSNTTEQLHEMFQNSFQVPISICVEQSHKEHILTKWHHYNFIHDKLRTSPLFFGLSFLSLPAKVLSNQFGGLCFLIYCLVVSQWIHIWLQQIGRSFWWNPINFENTRGSTTSCFPFQNSNVIVFKFKN